MSRGIAAGLTLGLLFTGCHRSEPVAMPPPEVTTIVVAPQAVTLTTELPGRTAAYRVAEIRPQVNGLIQRRLYEEGSEVSAGQPLYQIDPEQIKASLDSATAALRRSEASLVAARQRAERFKQLIESKAVSIQDFDDADAAFQQAQADVLYYKAAVQSAAVNLGYTKITSPIAGRIGRSTVTDGAIVTAYQPRALATVQQLDPIYVDVAQSTDELLRLSRRIAEKQLNIDKLLASKVRLVLSDGSKYAVEGTLQFRDVEVDPTTASVTLRAVFPNPQGTLLPSMFVRAILTEGVNEAAILVPQQAVTRNSKGEAVAFVVNAEKKIEVRQLTLDRAIDSRWIIAAGLSAGEHLVVEGMQKTGPGATVREVPFRTESSEAAQPNQAAK